MNTSAHMAEHIKKPFLTTFPLWLPFGQDIRLTIRTDCLSFMCICMDKKPLPICGDVRQIAKYAWIKNVGVPMEKVPVSKNIKNQQQRGGTFRPGRSSGRP